ncbi:DUF4236 domain-containing protein [Pontibacter fetidus]|uniref:DUF4236 domain-containing protein n=1 Tax=Pontibacter fetidus TaxID=2700082 RepID=A0A6B2H2N7_9BACT|nr:DUF4236 domain-containing protein [Pontibacter fetidus]NDK57375.1 DUF4236 domain-containing protein [Pontibacter fetidus]
MGFRFRKSFKLMPGVRLNVSKSGLSTSIGGKGATVNISRKGTRTTVGIPGSGVSYSTYKSHRTKRRNTSTTSAAPHAPAEQTSATGCLWLLGVVLFLGGLATLPSTGGIICLLVGLALLVLLGLSANDQRQQVKAVQQESLRQHQQAAQALDIAYQQRLVLMQARVVEGLLSSEQKTLYASKIKDRNITIADLDAALEQARLTKARILDLQAKYGEEVASKLLQEAFWIGMTRQQVLEAKNRAPDKIEVEVMKTKTKETLVYGNKSSGDVFVLENGLVTRFKDR